MKKPWFKIESCLNPLLVSNKYNHKQYYVNCGKCVACLNQKSFHWKFRVEDECSFHRYSIFFTLTYDNDHIPFIVSDNYVFNDDGSVKSCSLYNADGKFLTDYDGEPYYLRKDLSYPTRIGVLSKRDIQLFLKRLRINIYRKSNVPNEEASIRYFIAGEYGSTTYRPHYHGIIWTDSEKLCSWLVSNLSEAWPLCDKSRTDNYVSLVEQNAPQYVSAYLNSFGYLPLYLQLRDYRPFHLSSKNPPIGYKEELPTEVKSAITNGTFELYRRDSKTRQVYTVPIPSYYLAKYFPKCRYYSELSIVQRIKVYSKSFNGLRKECLQFISEHGYASLDYIRKRLVPWKKWFASRGFVLGVSFLMRTTSSLSKALSYYMSTFKASAADYFYMLDSIYKHISLRKLKEQIELVNSLIEQKALRLVRYVYPLNLNQKSPYYVGNYYHLHSGHVVNPSDISFARRLTKWLYLFGDYQASLLISPNFANNLSYSSTRHYQDFKMSEIQTYKRLTKFKHINEQITPQMFQG